MADELKAAATKLITEFGLVLQYSLHLTSKYYLLSVLSTKLYFVKAIKFMVILMYYAENVEFNFFD